MKDRETGVDDRIFNLLEIAYYTIARAYQEQIENREFGKICDLKFNGDKRYIFTGLWSIQDTETGKEYDYHLAWLFHAEESIEACNAFAEAFNNRSNEVQDGE